STWLSLPEKPHFTYLFASRLFDFIHLTAIQSYVLDQIKSFDTSISDAKASQQLGLLNGGFTAAQAVTSMLWGRVSDIPWFGRKPVLLAGLLGTAFSCIGLALSKSFSQALAFRILAGAVNGNGGISITIIAESVQDKIHLARAFLLLPLSYNLAALMGPILGAYSSNPVVNYPHIFGPRSAIGGESGILWMQSLPYALPALLCAAFLLICAVVGLLFLNEVRKIPRHHSTGMGLRLPYARSNNESLLYKSTNNSSNEEDEQLESVIKLQNRSSINDDYALEKPVSNKIRYWSFLSTKPIISTLVTQAIFDFHISSFGCILILFLCAPRLGRDEKLIEGHDTYRLSGGLQMSTREAGLATSIIGLVGVPLQLFLYPLIHRHFGTVRSYKIFSGLFPISYALIPFIPLSESSGNSAGSLTWISIIFILILHTIGRVVSVPATISLMNDASPHPLVLGAVNGLGQSVSAVARTLGPIFGSYSFAYGLENHLGVITWWILALVALAGTLM
ncbi:MFS general substrate transporter, partial [Stipitochalara longipes BDJ]